MMLRSISLVLLMGSFLLSQENSRSLKKDLPLADFEGENYGDWIVTGEAFGAGPARGTLAGQMAVDGFEGKGLVNSFFKGDGTTGTLTSPEFKIERRYLSFLIGGGKDPEKLAMKLLIDKKAVRTVTGLNDQAGGSEALVRDYWDVEDLIGKTAKIEIIDQATGGWGHINVDQIIQTDRKPPGLLKNVRQEFQVAHRYLNIPIKNGAPKRVVSLLVDGKLEVRNDIELADGEPDWWAPWDVAAWKGKTITLEVDKLAEDSNALKMIESSDEIRDSENLYEESLRGQFHFSPRRGWNNDPNGLVYFNKEYHLFFQHNPYGWNWGNMHWGHAVSKDLVHWEELNDVLAPDPLGPMFSGSAVVDWNNTSGLGTKDQPPMVLFYTAAGNPTVQCLAYSLDGRTFKKYEGNPIVPQFTGGNRDPKVLWHEPTGKWVMTLYVELNQVHTIHFFTSTNLKDWKFTSKTEGFFECPEFFELPVDNDQSQKKWVLTAANSEYMVGSFDGEKFTPETPKLPGHRGRGFYAAQTFSDIPAQDGRRIMIGWFQTATPGMPFNQSMTIPLDLKLVSTKDGPRLTFNPVKELSSLRKSLLNFDGTSLGPDQEFPLEETESDLLEIELEFEAGEAEEIKIESRGASVIYDLKKEELSVNDHRTSAPLISGKQRLKIYYDRNGLEVFASDGRTYVPMPYLPKPGDYSFSIQSMGGETKFKVLRIHELKSAWK